MSKYLDASGVTYLWSKVEEEAAAAADRAVSQIVIPDDYAREGSNSAATNTAIYEDMAKEATLGDVESALTIISNAGLPELDGNIARQGDNPSANISDIQAQGVNLAGLINNTLTVNMVTTGVQSMMGVPMHVILDSEGLSGSPLVVSANTLYYLENTRTDDLFIEFPYVDVTAQTTVNEFHFLFHQPNCTVVFGEIPNDSEGLTSREIAWQQGMPPQLGGGQDFYEIGILNGIGLWMYYSTANN